jgi:hypothetical protein
MSHEKPDVSLLQVSEQQWGEISPRAAYVHVTLTASKLFSGRSALEKAEELRQLANELEARDLPKGSLALEGVSLDVSTGLFSRSSSVTYRVRIHVEDVDRLSDVLDVVAAAPKATLSHLTWDYSGPAPVNAALLAECARLAAAKANALAEALGVVLDGAHSVREERMEDGAPPRMGGGGYDAPMAAGSRSSSIATELAGLDLAPTKRIGVRVVLDYRIRAAG